MATQVSVKAKSTGFQTYYSNYATARSAAGSGDVITIWADLDEQIILKDGVDIIIISGRILDMTSALPTVTDNGAKCICNIFGEGIIKNSYNGSTNKECVKLTHSQSEVFIECDYLEAPGGTVSLSTFASTVLVTNAAKFSLVCNAIYNHTDSAIIINNCGDYYTKCKTILSGYLTETNDGNSVIYTSGSGYIFADEVICNGYGSCIEQTGGNLYAKILKITTETNATTAKPTINLDNVSGDQNMTLYFDEIQNLNTTGGDAVNLAEGKGTLIGRRIYSEKGLSLNLEANANIKCSEIISAEKGVNIENAYNEKIIIESDLIEGSIGNNGVVSSTGISNYEIRNAKIKSTNTSSSSVGLYVDTSSGSPTMEFRNLIIVTGNDTSGESIKVIVGSIEATVKNYGLFVNKDFTDLALLIGTESNYKMISNGLVT